MTLHPEERWVALPAGESAALFTHGPDIELIVAFRFAGHAAPAGTSAAQTLFSAFQPGLPSPLWFGLRGPEQKLTVVIGPEPHRHGDPSG